MLLRIFILFITFRLCTMTIKTIVSLTTSALLLLSSCSKDRTAEVDDNNKTPNSITANIAVKGAAGYATTSPENEIRTIDVFSFAQFDSGAEYLFEQKNTIAISEGQTTLRVSLTGSLPRVLYFVANGTANVSYFSTLTTTKPTLDQFESLSIIRNSIAPEAPLTLVSKIELPNPQPATSVDVELSHAAASLVVDNKYAGFTIDSLVIRNAVSGAFLFNGNTPTVAQVPRVDINYGTQISLFLYQTEASVLAVYGKYNGIRAVFDIALNNIKSSTRYKVTFRSVNDTTFDFASNLEWNVARWNNGATVDSTPDWK